MQDIIRFAILGAGYMGQKHAHILANHPHAKVTWITGRTEDEVKGIANEVGAKGTTDIWDVLNDPLVDVVIVAYPTALHRDVTIQALQAGKRVFCEKPIALTIEDADAMLEAARSAAQSGGINETDPDRLAAHYLMIGQVIRFWPEYTRIQHAASRGDLGEILTVELERLSTSPKWASWFQDTAISGGMTVDLMVHDFDIASALLGTPVEVTAWSIPKRYNDWKHVHALIKFESGRDALIIGSHVMPDSYPFSSAIRVIGDAAVAEYRYVAQDSLVGDVDKAKKDVLNLYYDTESITLDIDSKGVLSSNDPYERQLNYLINCIKKNAPVEMGTPTQAKTALGIALGARRSLETGRSVNMQDILSSC